MAFDYAEKSGLDVVTICPTLVLGPVLQPTMNTSSSVLIKLLKGIHLLFSCFDGNFVPGFENLFSQYIQEKSASKTKSEG